MIGYFIGGMKDRQWVECIRRRRFTFHETGEVKTFEITSRTQPLWPWTSVLGGKTWTYEYQGVMRLGKPVFHLVEVKEW